MMHSNWQDRWRNGVANEDDLVRFVNDVGFCAINALERFPAFPNVAVAMGRPDPLWPAWFWKDDLHIQRRLYYTRVFAGKPGFLSLEFLPAFIATNGAVADELLLLGKMPVAMQELYRLLAERAPIATRRLKPLLTPEAKRTASGLLIELERQFIVTKSDITGRERGSYGYVWELAERWMPAAFTAADRLGAKAATRLITDRLRDLGVEPTPALLARVLRWEK